MSIRAGVDFAHQGLIRACAGLSTDKLRCLGVARFAELAIGLGLLAIVIVVGIVVRPLTGVDETRYLSVAWEMWQTGDWLVPHLNGASYSHKPVLLFWLIDAAWSMTGVSETAARLIPPVFALLSVWLTWCIGRVMWPTASGASARAALVLATTGSFMTSGSLVMFDAMLTAFALAALFGVIKASKSAGFHWWLVVGAFTGLGALTKGPVILVHVLPAALLAPLWAEQRPRDEWLKWYRRCGASLLVAAGVVALWLVPALISAEPAWRDDVLWQQSAGRIASAFAHARPYWYYVPFIPLIVWPWAWWPPLWRAVRREIRLSDPAVRFCILWLGSALIIFSAISGKQLHYLLPELPALALLAGRATGALKMSRLRDLILPAAPTAVVGLAVIAFALGIVDWKTLSPSITDAPPAGVTLLTIMAIAGILWALRKSTLAVALIAPTLALLIYINGNAPLAPLWDGQDIADVLAKHEDSGLSVIGKYRGEFTFLGRLNTSVVELQSAKQLTRWIADHPGGAFFGRIDKTRPEWNPVITSRWRAKYFGVWIVPRVPREEASPIKGSG